MKIEINIDSTDDGLKGDFNMVMGDKGIEFLKKIRDAIADPDAFIEGLGSKVMNGVLYGGGSKSKSPEIAEPSGGPAGY
jgi:hypothetical protein